MKKLLFSLSILCLVVAVSAQSDLDLSRYKQKSELKVEGITTPKVVTFESPYYLGSPTLLIRGSDGAVVNHRVNTKRNNQKIKRPFSIGKSTEIFEGNVKYLHDSDRETYISFDTNNTQHELEIVFPQKRSVSHVEFRLPNAVSWPKNITVQAEVKPGNWQTLISKSSFKSYLTWPKINASRVRFVFETPNLLRISELDFGSDDISSTTWNLSFFAREGESFTLYFDPDFGQKRHYATEKTPVVIDDKTPKFTLNSPSKNLEYNPDFDGDGVNDDVDLCPRTADPENTDLDKNGRGDVCEDPDNDGRVSSKDNCDFDYNPRQLDTDQDGVGDKCDDEENRLTENIDHLMYILFGLGVGVLIFLVVRNRKR